MHCYINITICVLQPAVAMIFSSCLIKLTYKMRQLHLVTWSTHWLKSQMEEKKEDIKPFQRLCCCLQLEFMVHFLQFTNEKRMDDSVMCMFEWMQKTWFHDEETFSTRVNKCKTQITNSFIKCRKINAQSIECTLYSFATLMFSINGDFCTVQTSNI